MKKLFLVITLFFYSYLSSQLKNKVVDQIIKDNPKTYSSIAKYFKDSVGNSESKLKGILDFAEKNKNTLIQIYSLNELGNIYRKNFSFVKSLDCHERAVMLSDSINDIEAKINSYNCIGVCYRWQTDIRNALDNHQKVLFLSANLENPSQEILENIGIAHHSIGEVYKELKQYNLSIKEYKEAIKIQQKLNNERGLAINYSGLGESYERLGNFDLALQNYYRSLAYDEKNNSDIGIVICNNKIAHVLIEKGQYQEAYNRLKEILEISTKLKQKKYLAQTLIVLAWSQLKLHNVKESENNFLKSEAIFNKLKILDSNYVDLCTHMSELYEYKRDYKKALVYYKRATEQDHETSGEQNILYVNNLISKYEMQSKNMKIKDLQSQTKLQYFETSRTRNILIITLVSLSLLSVALYSIYHQRLLNNDKKVLTLEQQALQAQMNPHFVFNALNSIKLYIINNEQKQAVYYLNKFSKLIRNILDASKNKEVSLQEELETMDVYITMENIRFNNEINYIKRIDETLKLDTVKVPPLILQPFIENSVWHGLSSKKGDKNIIIGVRKFSEGLMEISIEDNGIGREVAMKIKKEKSRTLQRKSIGIELTKERLKTFSADFTNDSSVKYFDLTNPTGTKVVLRIPIV